MSFRQGLVRKAFHKGLVAKIGTEERGRTVLHQSADIQKEAKAEHPDIKSQLHEVVSGIKGAEMHSDRPAKSKARTAEKVGEERQAPSTIPDFSAFRVAVDSTKTKHAVAQALRAKFKVVKEKDEFEHGSKDNGFHAHMMQVRHPASDVSHEVQVLPKHQADIADETHDLYDKARDGGKFAQSKLKAKNRVAWNSFKASNSERKGGRGESPEHEAGESAGVLPPASIKSGTKVFLHDGATGTVNHYNAGMQRGPVQVGNKERIVRGHDMIPLPDKADGVVAVDLDGTLAKYDKYEGPTVIGAPIPAMVDRVKQWIKDGNDVRIFTARITNPDTADAARKAIYAWCEKYIGKRLPVTNIKGHDMKIIYDDRARQVVKNEGTLVTS